MVWRIDRFHHLESLISVKIIRNCSIKLKNGLVLNFPVPVRRSQSVILHRGAGLTVHHGHHWVEMQGGRVVVATASRGKEASLFGPMASSVLAYLFSTSSFV